MARPPFWVQGGLVGILPEAPPSCDKGLSAGSSPVMERPTYPGQDVEAPAPFLSLPPSPRPPSGQDAPRVTIHHQEGGQRGRRRPRIIVLQEEERVKRQSQQLQVHTCL